MTAELLLTLLLELTPEPSASWVDRVDVGPGDVVAEAAHLPKHEKAAHDHGETFNQQRDRLFLEQGLHHTQLTREEKPDSFVELVAKDHAARDTQPSFAERVSGAKGAVRRAG